MDSGKSGGHPTLSSVPAIEGREHTFTCPCSICCLRRDRDYQRTIAESNQVQPNPASPPHHHYPWHPDVSHAVNYNGQPNTATIPPVVLYQQQWQPKVKNPVGYPRQLPMTADVTSFVSCQQGHLHQIGPIAYHSRHPVVTHPENFHQQIHAYARNPMDYQERHPNQFLPHRTRTQRNIGSMHAGWPAALPVIEEQKPKLTPHAHRYHPYTRVLDPPTSTAVVDELANKMSHIKLVVTREVEVIDLTAE